MEGQWSRVSIHGAIRYGQQVELTFFRTPFSFQLLKAEANSADASQPNDEQFLSLLPVSYGTDSDNVAFPSLHVITLDLQRMNIVFGWL